MFDLLDNLLLSPDDMGGGGGDIGTQNAEASSTSEDVSASPQQTETQNESPFFSYEDENGKAEFRTPEELRTAWRQGTLRHSDYTKKTTALAEERKKFDQEREQFSQQYQELLGHKKRYDTIDNFLKKNKNIADQLYREAARYGVRLPVDQREDKPSEDKGLPPEMKELLEWKKQTDEREQRERIYSVLEQSLPGFEREQVMREFQALNEAPEEDIPLAMAELVHFAVLGKRVSAQGGLPRQQQKTVVPAPSVNKFGVTAEKPKSIAEGYEAALRDYGR